MAPFYKRHPHDVHETRRYTGIPGMYRTSPAVDRHGSAVNKKVKAVCRKCNNGWMNSAEVAAKPSLIRLMNRQDCFLSPAEQNAIVIWSAIKMFVMEFDKPPTPAFTQETRSLFYKERALPTNLFIDLLAYEGGGIWTAAYHRQAIWIGDTALRPHYRPDGSIERNTQSITFGIGWLIIHIFHSYTLNAAPKSYSAISRRVWPPTGETISWPPRQIMTSDEIKAVSLAFDAYLWRKRDEGVPIIV